MTDRISALTVVLDKDIREDDVQPLVDAIRQMRNVISVEKGVVSPLEVAVAKQRLVFELQEKLQDVVLDLLRK